MPRKTTPPRAATSAERQAAYRARHLAEGTDVRLSCVVSAHAGACLRRLARHRGVTVRAMLDTLLRDAERATVAKMHRAELKRYLE